MQTFLYSFPSNEHSSYSILASISNNLLRSVQAHIQCFKPCVDTRTFVHEEQNVAPRSPKLYLSLQTVVHIITHLVFPLSSLDFYEIIVGNYF